MDRTIYSLHLFAGAGGGILADILAGVQPVCAVEIEPYPQRVLARRFPGLAIWDDVRTFRADNPDTAAAFGWLREHADELVVAGGFPCQDISSAGKGAGIERGARSGLWREFARIVREIRPRFVFVENSPMLVSRGLERVLGDLASCGYDAVWRVLAASDVGARHERERIWIVATLRDAYRKRRVPERVAQFDERSPHARRTLQNSHGNPASSVFAVSRALPDADRAGLASGVFKAARSGANESQRPRRAPFPTPRAHDAKPAGGCKSEMRRHSPGLNAIAANAGDNVELNPDWDEWLMGWPVGWTDIERDECDWRDLSVEPEDISIATKRRDNRTARIKAIGNGQVPLCAAVAFEEGLSLLLA